MTDVIAAGLPELSTVESFLPQLPPGTGGRQRRELPEKAGRARLRKDRAGIEGQPSWDPRGHGPHTPPAAAGPRQHRCCVFPSFPVAPGASSRSRGPQPRTPERARRGEPTAGATDASSGGKPSAGNVELPWLVPGCGGAGRAGRRIAGSPACAGWQQQGPRHRSGHPEPIPVSLGSCPGIKDGTGNSVCPHVMMPHGLCHPELLTPLCTLRIPGHHLQEFPIPVSRAAALPPRQSHTSWERGSCLHPCPVPSGCSPPFRAPWAPLDRWGRGWLGLPGRAGTRGTRRGVGPRQADPNARGCCGESVAKLFGGGRNAFWGSRKPWGSRVSPWDAIPSPGALCARRGAGRCPCLGDGCPFHGHSLPALPPKTGAPSRQPRCHQSATKVPPSARCWSLPTPTEEPGRIRFPPTPWWARGWQEPAQCHPQRVVPWP